MKQRTVSAAQAAEISAALREIAVGLAVFDEALRGLLTTIGRVTAGVKTLKTAAGLHTFTLPAGLHEDIVIDLEPVLRDARPRSDKSASRRV